MTEQSWDHNYCLNSNPQELISRFLEKSDNMEKMSIKKEHNKNRKKRN